MFTSLIMNKVVFVVSVALATYAGATPFLTPAQACESCGGGGNVTIQTPPVQSNSAAQSQSFSAAEGGSGGNVTSNPTASGGNAFASGGAVGPITIFGGSGTGSWGNLSVPPTDGVGGTIKLPDGREISLSAQCAVGFTKAGLYGSRQPGLWTIGGDFSTTLIHGQSNCRSLQDWLIKRAE